MSLVDNDDPVVTVSFDQSRYTAAEGGSAVQVQVSLSADPERVVSVPLVVSPGNGATDADYSGVPEQVIFDSGEMVKTFDVLATDDDVDDDGEMVTLSFGTLPDRVNKGGSASVSLVDNDDPVVTVSFDQSRYTAAEGGSAVQVQVSLSADPERVVSVPLVVSPGSGATDADYSGVPEQVIFDSGEMVKTFDVLATDDDVDDDGEMVTLSFGTLPDRVNKGGSASVSLVDNDERGVMVGPEQLRMPEGGGATYTVVLTSQPTEDVTVDVSVPSGTDVSVDKTSLTFTPLTWYTAQTVAVSADEDEDAVVDDAVRLTHAVSGGDYEGVFASDVTVTITETTIPVLSIDAGEEIENVGEMVFTVRLSVANSKPVTLVWMTKDGTAKAGGDYEATSGTLRFEAMEVEKTVSVLIINDDVLETNETFAVVLSNAVNAAVEISEARGTIIDDDLPLVSIAADAATVVEGESAVFKLMQVGDVTVPLSVSVQVSREGAFFSGTPPTTVMFEAGSAVATLQVATQDDDLDEPDGAVRVAIAEDEAYALSESASATVLITDNDDAPDMTIGDVRGVESDGEMIFTVTLGAVSGRAVMVDWATEDGTAKAGEDYEGMSGTLRFEAMEVEKTVRVVVVDDALDEVDETFAMVLSNAVNATVVDGEAIGTIINDDVAVTKAYLARFGRTVASHVLDAVDERVSGVSGRGSHVSLGGQRLNLSGDLPDLSARVGVHPAVSAVPLFGPAGNEQAGLMYGYRNMSLQDFLMRSSFLLSRQTRWTVWGRGATTQFRGEEIDFSLKGGVVTGMLGVDYERGRMLGGVAVSHSMSTGEFDVWPSEYLATREDELESSLTGVYPYLRVALNERLSAWGLLGYGRGDLSPTTGGTGIGMKMGALGMRGVLLRGTGGFALALRSDGFMVQMQSDADADLPSVEADARQLRLVLEGTRNVVFSLGRALAPSLEVGVRHDGGDAETGIGLEVGVGLGYADQNLGLTMETSVRGLLAHRDSNYREWGLGGSINFDPGASERGLSLRLRSSWGAVSSGVNRLYSQRSTVGMARNPYVNSAGVFDAELRYGMDAPGGRGLLTPYADFAFSGGGTRAYGLGWRLNLGRSFRVDMTGYRRERTETPPVHGVMLRAALYR